MIEGTHFFVDERPSNLLKEPSIYLFSRPFNLRSVKPNDKRKIYTTPLLKSSMLCNENIRNSIEVIQDDGSELKIPLPNGEFVSVRAFAFDTKTLNIIFLLQHRSKNMLYAGRYKSSSNISDHRFLAQLMYKKSIDELYIDTTSYNVNEFNLTRKASKEIQALVLDKKIRKLQIFIPGFGYEDLIFDLADNEVKVYLDPYSIEIFKVLDQLDMFCDNQDDADVILVYRRTSPEDTEKLFREQKIVTVLLTGNKIESSEHCRVVTFSPNPTRADIVHITYLAAPKTIFAINNGNLPEELCELCQ